MVTFRYAPEILARYPAVVGGVMLASGLSNGPSPDALRAEYAAEQEAVRSASARRRSARFRRSRHGAASFAASASTRHSIAARRRRCCDG